MNYFDEKLIEKSTESNILKNKTTELKEQKFTRCYSKSVGKDEIPAFSLCK